MTTISVCDLVELVGDAVVERAAWRVAAAMSERGECAASEAIESAVAGNGVDGLIDLESLAFDLGEVVDRALADAARRMTKVEAPMV